MRYSRTEVLLLALVSLAMCFITSASSSGEDPHHAASSSSRDQLTTERLKRQRLDSIEECLECLGDEGKVRINCCARLGGSHSPAVGVFEELQKKLQGKCPISLEFSKDNSEAAGYYTGEKGLSTEEGLKLFVSRGRKMQIIAECISCCPSFSSCLFRRQSRDYVNKKILPVVPDMIYVSTVPNLHHIVAKYSRAKELRIPILCVPCDAGELSKGSWIQDPNVLYFPFCRAQIERAKKLGCKYVEISGLPLRSEFKNIREMPKREMKKRLEFSPDEPLVLVFFGAAGSHRAREIAEILKDVNAIIICGKDNVSKEELESIGNPRHKILGFASAEEVAKCTRASDCVAGKTGGSQVAEAAHCESVFISCKKYALPWERCNADWVLEQNIGKELESWDELPAAIAEVMKNKADYEKRFAELGNNGAKEVADIIAEMANNKKTYETWQNNLWGLPK